MIKSHTISSAVLILTLIPTARARATDLDAGERVKAALIVLAPGTADLTLEPHILKALRAHTQDATSLDVVSAAALGVPGQALSACAPQRLLTCAVGVMDARGARAEALVIVSVLSLGDARVQLRALALDLRRARATLDDRSHADDEDNPLENRLYLQAHESPIVELTLSDEPAVSAYFRELGSALPAAIPIAVPLGGIAFHVAARGDLTLDDRLIGAVETGAATLAHVRPGTRTLRVVDHGGAVLERVIEVKSARVTRLGLEAEVSNAHAPAGDWHGSRRLVTWSGAALGTAGIALMIAAAASGGGVRQGCLTRATDTDAACAGLGSPTFAFDADAAPSTDPDGVNPASLAPLPLGAALVGAGVVWSLGTLIAGDDADHPWWIVASGLAVGALVFGAVGLAAR